MSKKFSNFKRFMTMFLVVVMLVGMLPMTASAAGGAKSNNGTGKHASGPVGHGSGTGQNDPTYLEDQGRFTRFTLVYFPFSDETAANKSVDEWSTGEVVGSIDVLTDGSVPAGTKYFKVKGSNLLSNAFSYRKGQSVEFVSGYSYTPLFGDLPAYPTSNLPDMPRYIDGVSGDPLMYKLGGINGVDFNPDVDQWAINSTFNQILKLIVDNSSHSKAREQLTKSYSPDSLQVWDGSKVVSASTLPAAEAAEFKYSYNFISSAVLNKTCYRLLVEPGVITTVPDGMDEGSTMAAVTLRDIASILLTETNDITHGNQYHGYSTEEYEGQMGWICALSKGLWVTSNGVLSQTWRKVNQFWFVFWQFYRLQRHAFGLYTTDNTFRTYVVARDSSGKATNVVFNKTPDGDAFFGHISVDTMNAFFDTPWDYDVASSHNYSGYAIAQYVLDVWTRGNGMNAWKSNTRQPLGGNIPVIKEGTYAALGLGVIEPGTMATTVVPATNTITIKKIIGNGLDKNEKWDFKLSVPKSDYESVCNADVGVSITYEGGTEVSLGEEGDNKVYSFKLGNEESITFTVKIPNAAQADYVRDKLVWTIEEVAAKGLLDANEGIEDENEKFSVTINDVPDDDGIISGVQLGTTTVYKNQKGPPPEGNLHVIVDYNFPGAAATSDPDDPMNGNVLDCGIHPAGEVVDLTLVAGG